MGVKNYLMPNQRAAGKKLIGAQASAELWRGVDDWLEKNANKTTSDFVLEACLEKLEKEGIKIDRVEALRDLRARTSRGKINSSRIAAHKFLAHTKERIAAKSKLPPFP